MSLMQYVSDQKWLLITFYFIMLIISILISVDPALKVSFGSLLYLDFISIIMFNVYFIGSYFNKKNQLDKWQQVSLNGLGSLVESATHEQQIYLEALKQLDALFVKQIHKRNENTKEQLEFMTHWFHEIKTPIAVSRLLLETKMDSGSLCEEIDKIEGYVEQALYFSRLNEFNKDYLIQEFDLEKLIKEIIKAESKTFISKKIKVDLHVPTLTVLSDKKALTYIIRQLVHNALKYTMKNGEIHFVINPEKRNLTIRDNGIGIPSEDLPRVFEKGFTGNNGRTHQRSTGMGLYLAKKTAEKLGHGLSIFSTLHEGTEVVVYFPDRSDTLYKL
ncbi:sensor histidine kinase [Paenibacillus sp. BSR1-1]|uniref:sensor histidine kinase n=1 Tax=Paenibacillus sp. BSR1-1 TaxID=3020845 RepID=UPI0025B1B11E|nr:sensor histidine kinase [Paenibacillus sp. BSR1-1]MDN3015964.1 sensor histidine kinase [Paenibacillus sp. BSR1-1]